MSLCLDFSDNFSQVPQSLQYLVVQWLRDGADHHQDYRMSSPSSHIDVQRLGDSGSVMVMECTSDHPPDDHMSSP